MQALPAYWTICIIIMALLWQIGPFLLHYCPFRVPCLLSPVVCYFKLSRVIISGQASPHLAEMFLWSWPERLTPPCSSFLTVSYITSCHIGLFSGGRICHILGFFNEIYFQSFVHRLLSLIFCLQWFSGNLQTLITLCTFHFECFIMTLLYFQHFLRSLALTPKLKHTVHSSEHVLMHNHKPQKSFHLLHVFSNDVPEGSAVEAGFSHFHSLIKMLFISVYESRGVQIPQGDSVFNYPAQQCSRAYLRRLNLADFKFKEG